MLKIEYRHADRVGKTGDVRRDNDGMKDYLRDLVREMKEAKISATFTESAAQEGEENSVRINGRDIREILNGLKIIFPEDEEICDDRAPKMVTFGRPVLQWNERHIEDIPDILMKNAISKVYSEMP
jgi:hypothetical protein